MPRFAFLETKYRTTTISWLFIIGGLLLVLLGNELSDNIITIFNVDVGVLISNVGGFIAIVALMEWLYDSFVRRLFFEEIITTVTATRSIYDCGILEAFSNSIKANHAKSVLESNTLVMLFAHSKRFIDSYFDEFARRVRSGKKTIIYCNHPKSAAAIYYSSCGRNQNYIESSIAELISMIGKLDVSGQMIKVEYINVVPRYALVMFDDIAYVIMATSSEGQAAVPALVVRRGSPMWRFLEDDLDRIRTNHCYTGPHQ